MAYSQGQQLGSYRIIRFLGRGGFADVYLAEHMYLNKPVAVKVLHAQAAGNAKESFIREAQTIARLEHPNIVRVTDCGIEDETPFLVMDYAPDGTLRQRHQRGTKVPLDTVISYVTQIADALQYTHDRNLVHCDVKPDNVLIGTNKQLWLSDFGIVSIVHNTSSEIVGERAGTRYYMAPEQIRGRARPASDQYAPGIMIYEWLGGETPFSGNELQLMYQHLEEPVPSLHDKNPTIPTEVEQVVMTALAKDPHRRFDNIKAFTDALMQAAQPAKRVIGPHPLPSSLAKPAFPASPARLPDKIGMLENNKYLMRKAIGIDLGLNNSAVAIMTPTDTEITIHSDPKTRRETTPSCVWKDPKNGQVIVGRHAYSRVGSRPEPIKSIRRSMGQQITMILTNEQVTPEQVSASILSEIKRQIEDNLREFETESATWVVDRAIVTVPAYFDQPQVAATRKAAEMAGLHVLELLHEPTAAALYHCWQNHRQDGLFLVYDFGGGTFDVSILRCTGGAFEVLGISGNNYLGGDDLDAVIAEEILRRLVAEGYDLALDIQHNEDDRLRFATLKLLAEGVKKALSTTTDFVLRDTARLRDQSGASVEIDMNFERDEVEQLMRPIIERTIPYCRQALELAQKRAGVTLAQIDEIILVSGSTHIPLVREIVRETFCSSPTARDERARCSEPVYRKVDTIVALGAAIRAAATGGLTIDNPERTVRVAFKGIGATALKQTYVAGQVEVLSPTIDLAGGSIRLRIADMGYDDEQPLKSGGAFRFSRVELKQEAENLLTFEIYNRIGTRIATVGRPISQSKEAARPTGGPTGTATTAKACYLEFIREGKVVRKELIPASATLPTSENFPIFHPGNTELLRLPLYQNKKKILEIQVSVPANLPEGTPIDLMIEVDELSSIAVSGSVKDTDRTFHVTLEIPPEREAPTPHEVQQLDQAFYEVVVALSSEQKTRIEDQYRRARSSYENGVKRGELQRAIHDFEEMEDLVESCRYGNDSQQSQRLF
ncbi:MAG: Hsp70 family protein [Ktedonobacteraceae bacterium]